MISTSALRSLILLETQGRHGLILFSDNRRPRRAGSTLGGHIGRSPWGTIGIWNSRFWTREVASPGSGLVKRIFSKYPACQSGSNHGKLFLMEFDLGLLSARPAVSVAQTAWKVLKYVC